MNNCPPEEMIGKLAKATCASPSFVGQLGKLETALKLNRREAFSFLGEGWTGIEAVPLALYCFLKTPNDYETTVLKAANTKGSNGKADSDSIASIAGAISGAYNGIKAIPGHWVREVENSEMLGKIADTLYGLNGKNAR